MKKKTKQETKKLTLSERVNYAEAMANAIEKVMDKKGLSAEIYVPLAAEIMNRYCEKTGYDLIRLIGHMLLTSKECK